MKFVLNILKAFLISFLFIGLTHAATTCPSISPKIAGDGPVEQVEAILNDVVCAFIDLNNQNNFHFFERKNLRSFIFLLNLRLTLMSHYFDYGVQ